LSAEWRTRKIPDGAKYCCDEEESCRRPAGGRTQPTNSLVFNFCLLIFAFCLLICRVLDVPITLALSPEVRGNVVPYAVDPHRLRNVLNGLFSLVNTRNWKLIRNLVVHRA